MPRDHLRALIVAEIPHLRRYARALTRTRQGDEADDLVQACLERALSKADSWQPGSNLRAWLFTILHNLYVSQLRRPDPVLLLARYSTAQHATLSRPEAYVELGAMEKALNELPSEQRDVILLVGLEGLTYEQVASVLEVPVGTVRSRLSRGRSALRARLERSKPASAAQSP